MPNWQVELYAPRGEISPDPELAHVVLSAASAAEARSAAEKIIEAERDDCECYVTWESSPGEEGVPFELGIHVRNVFPTSETPEYDAASILAGGPKKSVQVTVHETVYKVTVVNVLVGPNDDIEEVARETALKAEWEEVAGDGFSYQYENPFEGDES